MGKLIESIIIFVFPKNDDSTVRTVWILSESTTIAKLITQAVDGCKKLRNIPVINYDFDVYVDNIRRSDYTILDPGIEYYIKIKSKVPKIFFATPDKKK